MSLMESVASSKLLWSIQCLIMGKTQQFLCHTTVDELDIEKTPNAFFNPAKGFIITKCIFSKSARLETISQPMIICHLLHVFSLSLNMNGLNFNVLEFIIIIIIIIIYSAIHVKIHLFLISSLIFFSFFFSHCEILYAACPTYNEKSLEISDIFVPLL